MVSGAGTALSAVWSAYAAFTTASALPSDATRAADLLADPPIYLPWLVLVSCVIVLAWSLWPRPDEPEPDANGVSQKARDHATQIGNARDVYIGHPPPPALQEQKRPVPSPRPRSRGITARQFPEPEPNLPMKGMLGRVYKAVAPHPRPENFDGAELLRKVNLEIIDKITRYKMHVWGRVGDFGLDLISEYDLKYATVNHVRQEIVVAGEWSTCTYTDIHFDRREVNERWPPPLETTNAGNP